MFDNEEVTWDEKYAILNGGWICRFVIFCLVSFAAAPFGCCGVMPMESKNSYSTANSTGLRSPERGSSDTVRKKKWQTAL